MQISGNKSRLQLAVMDFKRCWQLHLFLLLPLVYLLVFQYYPMFGVQIAFKDFTPGLGIWGSKWVGFDHFVNFFKSYQFGRVVGNTLTLSIYSLLVEFPLAIIFALMLNAVRQLKFKKFVQTITYIPYFVSIVVMVGILVQAFNPVIGVYGTFYRLLGGEGYPDSLMGSAAAFPHLYVWSNVWKNLGWNSIIYMAALANVSPELHEAAEIDGASRWKRVLHIDFPSIIPTISILLILRVGSLMSVGFEQAFLMQTPMNLMKSEIISTYVYKVGIAAGGGNFSFAAAVGLFNSVINSVLLVTTNAIVRKYNDSSLW